MHQSRRLPCRCFISTSVQVTRGVFRSGPEEDEVLPRKTRSPLILLALTCAPHAQSACSKSFVHSLPFCRVLRRCEYEEVADRRSSSLPSYWSVSRCSLEPGDNLQPLAWLDCGSIALVIEDEPLHQDHARYCCLRVNARLTLVTCVVNLPGRALDAYSGGELVGAAADAQSSTESVVSQNLLYMCDA